MKRILVVSGSRADFGLLEWPVKVLKEEFEVELFEIWGLTFPIAFNKVEMKLKSQSWDLMLILGDRYEILAAATAAHLLRIPIAHIGGGDVTEGSYDDAMRDSISRMASIHFVCSNSAMARLSHMGYRNVHLVGNPGIDFIRGANWNVGRPIAEPYMVVSYQAETLNEENHWPEVLEAVKGRRAVVLRPNPDRGSEEINAAIDRFQAARQDITVHSSLPHAEFLNLIYYCQEFIGNSSSMLYEAPELGIKTRMIGKRQKGRTIPWGDGQASLRIRNILKYT